MRIKNNKLEWYDWLAIVLTALRLLTSDPEPEYQKEKGIYRYDYLCVMNQSDCYEAYDTKD